MKLSGIALVWTLLLPAAAVAQGSFVITRYPGATTMVQDPPGTPWRAVPSADLPLSAPVLHQELLSHVVISHQGRTIWLRASDVQMGRAGGQPPCPPGTSRVASADTGSMSLGGATQCAAVRR